MHGLGRVNQQQADVCAFDRSFGPERAASGFPRAFCLDEAELRRGLEPALRCIVYERLGAATDWLEGSVWQRDEA